MDLGLTFPFCSPSSGWFVPVNVFHREFACSRIHTIQHCVVEHCLFSHQTSLCAHIWRHAISLFLYAQLSARIVFPVLSLPVKHTCKAVNRACNNNSIWIKRNARDILYNLLMTINNDKYLRWPCGPRYFTKHFASGELEASLCFKCFAIDIPITAYQK